MHIEKMTALTLPVKKLLKIQFKSVKVRLISRSRSQSPTLWYALKNLVTMNTHFIAARDPFLYIIYFWKIHATDIFWAFNLYLSEYCNYKCLQMWRFTALSPGRNFPLVSHIRPPPHRTPGPSTRACQRLCSSSGRSTELSSGTPPSEALPLWCPTGHCTSSPTPWNWFV